MGNDLETGFYGQKIKSIQLLRAFAIIFVMIEHVSYWGFGAFGVDIFFVISGFVMMYSTHIEGDTKGYRKGLKSFLPKRLLRIIPLYYTMTILTYIAICVLPQFFRVTEKNPVQLIKSFLFIPYEIGGYVMPIVRVGWCLNYEVLFFLIFFIAFLISYKYRGLIAGGMLLVITILGFIVKTDSVPVNFWLADNNLEFVYGILAYYICRGTYSYFSRKREKKAAKNVLTWLFIIVSIGLAFLMSLNHKFIGDDLNSYRGINLGIPAFLVFILIFWTGCMIEIPKLYVFLGDISFSLFLTHYYPLVFFTRIGEGLERASYKNLLALAGFALSFAIAIPAYYIFERKIGGKIAVFLKKI